MCTRRSRCPEGKQTIVVNGYRLLLDAPAKKPRMRMHRGVAFTTQSLTVIVLLTAVMLGLRKVFRLSDSSFVSIYASPSSQYAFSAASRAGAGKRTEAHRKGETGHHDSPSDLSHDSRMHIGPIKEGGLAGGRPLPDRPPLLQPGSGSGEAALR